MSEQTMRECWQRYVDNAKEYGVELHPTERCAFYSGASALMMLIASETCCPAHMHERIEDLLREFESITYERIEPNPKQRSLFQ